MQQNILRLLVIILLPLFVASCGQIQGEILNAIDKITTPKKDRKNRQETPNNKPVIDEDPFFDSQDLEGFIPIKEDKTLKVAVMLPLSGKFENLGQSLLDSLQLAVFDYKKFNIQLVIYDTKGTSFGAVNAMRDIANQNIKLAIGPVFSSSIKAVSGIVKENNIITFSLSNNEELINNPNLFLMGLSVTQQVERIISYSIEQGKNNFVAILPNNEYGSTIARNLKSIAGAKDGNVINIEYYDANLADLDEKVNRIVNSYSIAQRVYDQYKEAKDNKEEDQEFIVEEEDKIYPDAILIGQSGKALSKIKSLIDLYNVDERDLQIIGTSNFGDISSLEDKNLLGSWFVGPQTNKYDDFEKHYYRTYSKFPPKIASLAYDTLAVIGKVAHSDIDNDIAMNDFYLKTEGFKGIDGLFRFLPNGLVERKFSILQISQGEFEVISEPMDEFLLY